MEAGDLLDSAKSPRKTEIFILFSGVISLFILLYFRLHPQSQY